MRRSMVMMATALLVVVAGCSGTDGQATEQSSANDESTMTLPTNIETTNTEPTSAEPTVTAQADSYFDPTDPSNFAQWGSHLVVATLTDERKIPQTVEPGPGGKEEPMPGPTLRGIELRVEEVLWSHPLAVTSVASGQVVSGTSASGWAIVNDEEVAIAFDGSVRMEVGGIYVVALVDDVSEGTQVLDYLDGSAAPTTDLATAELVAEVERATATIDQDNVPAPGVSFDERIHEFVLGQG